ncbi:unnamed protein product [Peronospora belbahrii]|uniref:Uncharacterized protein n=1 Tax=Peronospora belbahrii TaxID=622444 RepID=A0ABN8DEQ9_9STRA|nr:unnamed protein product [Peronospora belbahrii]
MASDPLSAVQQLQDVVTTLAPSLCPQVLPRGIKYGLDLIVSLCKTEEQRQALIALVRSRKPNEALTTEQDDAETDQEEKEQDDLKPQVIGTFDVKNRVFTVQKVQWMHERDAMVHEFARFMELQLENPIAANHVVQHFLEVNGHKSDAFILAQQCFSAAFALQTLLGAFPKPSIAIDGKVVKITQDSDVAKVFAPLLAPNAKKTKKKSTSMPMQDRAMRSKNRQQKLKKRKSVA